MTCLPDLETLSRIRGTAQSLLTIVLVMVAGCQKSPAPPRTEAPKPAPVPVFVPPIVVARTHFLGTIKMQQDTNLEVFAAISKLPESDTLKQETWEKLAQFALDNWRHTTNAANPDTGLLTPLFNDILNQESYFEIRLSTNNLTEWVLAVRLEASAAQVWETNFWKLSESLSSNAPVQFMLDGDQALKASLFTSNEFVCLTRTGEWSLLSGGAALPSSRYGLLSELKSSHQPSTNGLWLEVEIDAARMGPLRSIAELLKIGKAHFAVGSKKEALRAEGEFQLTAPNDWKLQSWVVPTNTIKDPLIGFTALQGFGPLLATNSWFKKVGWDPVPNELFLWVQPTLLFTTFAAVQVEHSTNLMEKIHQPVLDVITNVLGRHRTGQFEYFTNLPALSWKQLPVILPFLRPSSEPTDDFLEMGLIPLRTNSLPIPQELLDQVVTRTNLIYYDWEITAARLEQWPAMNQIITMATDHTLNPESTAADKWMVKIAPLLGNTVTEVSVAGPREWKFIRKAPVGFTSTELAFFLRWFNHSAFPRLGREFWFDPVAEGPYFRPKKKSATP